VNVSKSGARKVTEFEEQKRVQPLENDCTFVTFLTNGKSKTERFEIGPSMQTLKFCLDGSLG